jgi:hypothetical protein
MLKMVFAADGPADRETHEPGEHAHWDSRGRRWYQHEEEAAGR